MEVNQLEALQINIEPFGFSDSNSLINTNDLSGNGNMNSVDRLITGSDYLSIFKSLREISLMPIPAYRRIFLRDFIVNNNLYFSLTTLGCDLLHSLQVFSFLKRFKISASKVYMFRYNPNGVTKGLWTKEKNYSLITNMLKSYNAVSVMNLDICVKQLFLKHITNLLNYGLNQINILHLDDKIILLNNLDLKDVNSKASYSKLVFKYPSIYLFLYKVLGNRCSSFIIRIIDYCCKHLSCK